MYQLGGVLIPATDIAKRVKELGEQINYDYTGCDLLAVGILKGAAIFLADLVRAVALPLQLDFMAIASYGVSTQSTGAVHILKDLDVAIAGRHVLVVEDIVDTGLTLRYLLDSLCQRKPKSLAACALLDKPGRRRVEVAVDYVGFTIPDRFVVGYGLDYAQHYRHLPDIHIMVSGA